MVAESDLRRFDMRRLVDCAMGRLPADLLIRNGVWACVQSGEFVPGTDVAVIDGRVAYVGPDASHTLGPQTRQIDAAGRYITPGLLDAHMHIESGMLTVTEFVRAVVPHGTTGMFVDPHEIANVFGLAGVRLMVDEAALQPVHVFVQAPSCVPSAAGLETSGASIGPEEVAEALSWPGMIGLGEVMSYPLVIEGDARMHAEIAVARAAGRVIGGHYPSLDLGLPFHGYAAGGILDDHEGTRMEDAVARVRQGMRVMMRLGSAWHDVAEQVRAITELKLDPRFFMLCTDDSHSATLVNEGHVDRALRCAIQNGLPPMTALQMVTLNPAEYFGLSREMGLIAPGRYADVLIVPNLVDFHPDVVIARGQVLAEAGQLVVDLPVVEYPGWVTQSIHLPRALTAGDFRLESAVDGLLTANVIGVIENQAPTRHLRLPVMAAQGEVQLDPAGALAKVALIERHAGSGRVQVGLVQGFGFQVPCAVASSVAHDSHHLIVVGNDEASMATAANRLAEIGGGQVVVREGQVIGLVELPVGGLVSNERAELVAQKAETVLAGFRACGCSLNNPNMQLSLLGLVVIPELRISDLGLVDVERLKILPVLE